MKRISSLVGSCFFIAMLFSSCASYNAVALKNLSPIMMEQGVRAESEDVLIVAKAFNWKDCEKYLDRNVLSAGYQPVQLYIQNNSKRAYQFLVEGVSLPCASPGDVAKTVHTSTIGRVAGYSVGALFLWPLIIPAIVDGLMSSQANSALDADFSSKVAGNQVIFPYAHFNKIIFVPISGYQSSFSVTLMDGETNEPKVLKVSAVQTELTLI